MARQHIVDYFGATSIGPTHRAERTPNQDCWLGVRGAFGTLIVVSDGLGSKRDARRGAQMACRAVLEAVRVWHEEGSDALDDLLRRIEPRWLDRIAPADAKDCAATCLFALAHIRGRLHVAAIGDGMALVRTRRGALEWVVGPRVSGFANETHALGDSRSWVHRSLSWEAGDVVILASDGVADDLLPNRMNEFVTWVMGTFAILSPHRRWRELRRALTNWPTPRHTDDKTLVVLAHRAAVPS